MSYTKGPWLASNRTSRTHNHPARFWERNIHAADTLELVATAVGTTQEEAEANAEQIALVPELLDACKAAREWIAAAGTVAELNGLDEQIARLTMVITKAQGEGL